MSNGEFFVGLRVPRDLHSRLRAVSEADERSMSEIVRAAITKYVVEREVNLNGSVQ